ncbi:hypothetical protein [Fulvitalea axinellae]
MSLAIPEHPGLQAKSLFALPSIISKSNETLHSQSADIRLVPTGSHLSVQGHILFEVRPSLKVPPTEHSLFPFETMMYRGASCDTATMTLGNGQTRKANFLPKAPYKSEENGVSLTDDLFDPLKHLRNLLVRKDGEIPETEEASTAMANKLCPSPDGHANMFEYVKMYSEGKLDPASETLGINRHAVPPLGGTAVSMLQTGEATPFARHLATNYFAPAVAVSEDGNDYVSFEQRDRKALKMARLRMLLASHEEKFADMSEMELHRNLPEFQASNEAIWLEYTEKMKRLDHANQKAWFMKMYGSKSGQSFHDSIADEFKASPLTVVATKGKTSETKAPLAEPNLIVEYNLPKSSEFQHQIEGFGVQNLTSQHIIELLGMYEAMSSYLGQAVLHRRMAILHDLEHLIYHWHMDHPMVFGRKSPSPENVPAMIPILFDLLDRVRKEHTKVTAHIVSNAHQIWIPHQETMDKHGLAEAQELWAKVWAGSRAALSNNQTPGSSSTPEMLDAIHARLMCNPQGRSVLRRAFASNTRHPIVIESINSGGLPDFAVTEALDKHNARCYTSFFSGSLKPGKGSSARLLLDDEKLQSSRSLYVGRRRQKLSQHQSGKSQRQPILILGPAYISYAKALAKATNITQGESWAGLFEDEFLKKPSMGKWIDAEERRNISEVENRLRSDAGLPKRRSGDTARPLILPSVLPDILEQSGEHEELLFDANHFSGESSSDEESQWTALSASGEITKAEGGASPKK